MRKRQTFVLTILGDEDETASFRGRVKVIANGNTYTFTNLDELHRLICDEMGEKEDRQSQFTGDHVLNAIEATGNSSFISS